MILYYTSIDTPLPAREFQELCSVIPEIWRRKIFAFARWKDAHLSLFGKLLLKQGLEDIWDDQFELNDIQYTEFGKPYLAGCSDFSISHSERTVVCLFSERTDERIGIDIEFIKPIDLDDYASIFSKEEFQVIKKSDRFLEDFYSCWTKKEAIVKAVGCGLDFPLSEINTMSKVDVQVRDSFFYIREMKCFDAYALSLASSHHFNDAIDLRRISF